MIMEAWEVVCVNVVQTTNERDINLFHVAHINMSLDSPSLIRLPELKARLRQSFVSHLKFMKVNIKVLFDFIHVHFCSLTVFFALFTGV